MRSFGLTIFAFSLVVVTFELILQYLTFSIRENCV